MKSQPLVVSQSFQDALDLMEAGHNLFITGKAGTGKSTLLRLFRNTTEKKVVVLAPTGIAALHIGGQTLHSFFSFPPRPLSADDIKPSRNKRFYQSLDTIIVDEISMVRADVFDAMDYFLRKARKNQQPFGGIQFICFGDLFQLPPVVSSRAEANYFSTYYESPYFFSAHVFHRGFELEGFELSDVYRQTDPYFLKLLDRMRYNTLDEDDLEAINERYMPNFESDDFYITLSARNHTVNRINQEKLQRIPHLPQKFLGQVTGSFNPKLFPTDPVLELKKDAQVMFIKNHTEKKFMNGSVGKVVDLTPGEIYVQLDDQSKSKKPIKVEQETWEILKYKQNEDQGKIETETVGTFTQYPLKPSWAITIHRSQGKTFEKVIIDMGSGAFASGQTYVALSRCKSLEGIVLKSKLRWRDILVDERVTDFHQQVFR